MSGLGPISQQVPRESQSLGGGLSGQCGEPTYASGRRGHPLRKNRRVLVSEPDPPGLKPSSGSCWLGELVQFTSLSFASISLGVHGTCPTSFTEHHGDQRKSEPVVLEGNQKPHLGPWPPGSGAVQHQEGLIFRLSVEEPSDRLLRQECGGSTSWSRSDQEGETSRTEGGRMDSGCF